MPTTSQEVLAIDGGNSRSQGAASIRAASLFPKKTFRPSADVLRSDWLTTGPKSPNSKKHWLSGFGAKYAVAFSSGHRGPAWSGNSRQD